MTNRVAFAACATSCAASVGFLLPSRWQNLAAARRLAWGSAAWGVPVALRQGREVLAGRDAPWALLGQLGLVGTGFAGFPWTVAVAAVAARARDLRGDAIRPGDAVVECVAAGADLSPAPLNDDEGKLCPPSCS